MKGRAIVPRLAIVVALTGIATGCAQITTTHEVSVIEKPGAKGEPIVLGAPQGQVTKRGLDATWAQHGDHVEVTLHETRRCAALRHEPVVRVDKVVRKTGGALYWEYGLAGATLGLGMTALIRPDLFSQSSVNSDGDLVEDLRSGYRVGGIFTAIGTAFLVAGIYDTVRARDETRYVDAYRVHRGEEGECAVPRLPLDGQMVELIVGEWRTEEETDADGRVRLLLPTYEELGIEPPPLAPPPPPEGPEPPPPTPEPTADPSAEPVEAEPTPPPPPPATIHKGVLRIDPQRAAAIDFVIPYDHPDADGHAGEIMIEPIRLGGTEPPGE